jgi:hypothetical protein
MKIGNAGTWQTQIYKEKHNLEGNDLSAATRVQVVQREGNIISWDPTCNAQLSLN